MRYSAKKKVNGVSKPEIWLDLKFTKKYDKERFEHMVNNGEVKEFDIQRKLNKNLKYDYYACFTIEGDRYSNPYQIKNKPKNKRGRVGIDLGIQTIAVVNEYGDQKLFDLDYGVERYESRIIPLQQELDKLRRINNPSHYNENGTPKKGGKKEKWITSKRMDKLNRQIRYLHQSKTDTGVMYRRAMANEISRYGDKFYVEGNNVEEWKERLKVGVGRLGKKKKFGKSVQRYAPSNAILYIKDKSEVKGFSFNEVNQYKLKPSQFNHVTGKFVKKQLSERSSMVGDKMVQRDLYSAFLLANLITKVPKSENETLEYVYDIENLNTQFSNFVEKHNLEILRLSRDGIDPFMINGLEKEILEL